MSSWIDHYQELSTYIGNFPEIRINPTVTVIPEYLKAGFYQRFDAVRFAFLREQFQYLQEEVRSVKNALDQVRKAVLDRAWLKSIKIGRESSQFLDNPRQSLLSELFVPLFHLLKTEMDPPTWTDYAREKIQRRYTSLFKRAYIYWIVLTLIDLLKSNACYRIEVPRLEISAREPVSPLEPKPVPSPQLTDHLSFLTEAVPSFIVPQIIIHSPLAGRYIAFRCGPDSTLSITKVLWTANEYDPLRQWIVLDKCQEVVELPSLMIYTHDSLKNAGLIADAQQIARPDLVVELEGPFESRSMILDKINNYRKHLAPVNSIVLPYSPDGGYTALDNEQNANGMAVGLDEAGLQPVLEALL